MLDIDTCYGIALDCLEMSRIYDLKIRERDHVLLLQYFDGIFAYLKKRGGRVNVYSDAPPASIG